MTNQVKPYFISFLVVLTVISCSSPSSDSTLPSKPNVLFIVVDDLGWKDLGFMGNPWFDTPNIDSLSKQGMIFTQAYAGASNCAPSRASLMTGMATPKHGIYTVSPSARGDARTRRLIPTKNTRFLEDDQATIGDLFQEAEYQTGTFGKWHVGQDPLLQGFDKNIAGGRNGNPGRNGYFSPYNVPNIEDGPEGEYLPDRLTDEVIQFMRDNQDTSFFAYLPFYTVHTPLQGKQDLIDKYLELPRIQSQKQAIYGAMVEAMDMNIGRLMSALRELNLDKSTLVIFTSDNGGIAAISPQVPLRAGKGSYYEGGIRVPLVMRWPEVIPEGSQNHTPTMNFDFFPTFSEILNIEKSEGLDGESLIPSILGKETNQRALIWHFPIYLEAYDPVNDGSRDILFRTRPGSIIRRGKWKLHEYFERNELVLYNLEEDLTELKDVSEQHPEIVRDLLKELNDWREKMEAPVPTQSNPEYDPKVEAALILKLLSDG